MPVWNAEKWLRVASATVEYANPFQPSLTRRNDIPTHCFRALMVFEK